MKNLTPRLNRLEPNIVIDGGMEIWPEGNSRSVTSGSNLYGSVLFQATNISSGVTLTNSRQTSIPSGTNLIYSNQISKTAAGTLAAGTNTVFSHYVEGYNVDKIYNKDFSVIFWVKSSVASNRSMALNNVGNSHSLVKQYSINSINTWELKVLKFSALNTCPGTINRENDRGVSLRFSIVNGSTVQTATLNAWQSGFFLSGIGEDTTWLTGTTHDFSITGVMVLPGDWTSLTSAGYQFLRAGKDIQEEIAKSERYFEKSYDLAAAPGSSNANGVWMGYPTDIGSVTDRFGLAIQFSKRKRTVPSVLYYNWRGDFAQNKVSQYNADTNNPHNGGSGTSTPSETGVSGYLDCTNNLATGSLAGTHWVADARF